jgi:hypothetical protein
MNSTIFTPEEQAAMLPPMPGQRVPQFAPQPEAPRKPCRSRSPDAATRNREQTRVRSARARLAESRAMLTAAHASANPAAIVEAERWVAHRAEGLSRLLAELGLPPETP